MRLPDLTSVKARLTILAAGLSILILLGGLLVVTQAYHQQNTLIAKQLQFTARALTTGVDVHLREYISLLQTLAQTRGFRTTNLVEIEQLLQRVPLPENVSIFYSTATGSLLAQSHPGVRPPILTSAVQSASHDASATNIFISNFEPARADGRQLSVTLPLGGGERLLTLAFPSEVLSESLALRQMAGDNLITIVDRNGVIAARSRDLHKFLGQSASPSFWQQVIASRKGVLHSVTLDGTPVITTYERSHLSGWTIVHAAPRYEALASAQQLLFIGGVLGIACLVITFLTVRRLSHALVEAIDTLVQMAATVGKGGVPDQAETGLRETNIVAFALRTSAQSLNQHAHELEEFKKSLEHRIQTQTVQLRATNAELSITNRQLEDFGRIAAHDLREPLRTISAFSIMLLEDHSEQLSPKSVEDTQHISAEARKLSTLLDKVLLYSKIPAMRHNPDQVSLSDLVADIRNDLAGLISLHKGQLLVDPLPTVTADPLHFRQLFICLIENGFKFARRDIPPIVRISSSEADSTVRITVQDNGIGFDSNLTEALFQPFHRLHDSTERPGFGMGLAVARRIVEKHGGTIRAIGVSGQGSRFEITLPKNNEYLRNESRASLGTLQLPTR
ncbi:MAG TPA: ATP-binding protein [Candidatus Kapabacteria bacterium]|nr:ATP-binding protein [Candidatus Kapabacteria bacterium]